MSDFVVYWKDDRSSAMVTYKETYGWFVGAAELTPEYLYIIAESMYTGYRDGVIPELGWTFDNPAANEREIIEANDVFIEFNTPNEIQLMMLLEG